MPPSACLRGRRSVEDGQGSKAPATAGSGQMAGVMHRSPRGRARFPAASGLTSMSFDGFTIAWLVLGVVLILAELLLPGLVVVFLGVAALLVGGLAAFGLITGWTTAVAAWSVSSLALVLGLRSGAQRLLPGEADRTSTNEDVDAFGEVVEVVEDVGPFESGRIRLRDVTWAAQTIEGRIPKGARARIVARDNLIWIVEPES